MSNSDLDLHYHPSELTFTSIEDTSSNMNLDDERQEPIFDKSWNEFLNKNTAIKGNRFDEKEKRIIISKTFKF